MNDIDPIKLKEEIRQRILVQRKAISKEIQDKRSLQLADILCNESIFLESNTIAGYWANAGELDLTPVMKRAWDMGKRWCLPVLEGAKNLVFVEYNEKDPLSVNRYGISEPIKEGENEGTSEGAVRNHILSADLDLVLVPLVAFDSTGNRLGMGAGFYDSTFQFLLNSTKENSAKVKPILIGVAHDFQKVESIPKADWDVPLSGVVTEKRFIWFR